MSEDYERPVPMPDPRDKMGPLFQKGALPPPLPSPAHKTEKKHWIQNDDLMASIFAAMAMIAIGTILVGMSVIFVAWLAGRVL